MEQNNSNLTSQQLRRIKIRYFVFGGVMFSAFISMYLLLTPTSPTFSFADKSDTIIWEKDAIPLFNNYKDHKRRFRVKDTTDNSEIKTLKAVIFESKHLESLINYSPGRRAKYVYLYFGMEKKGLREDVFTLHPRYKIVAVAADSINGRLSLLTNLVYDKTDPCPELCPENSPY